MVKPVAVPRNAKPGDSVELGGPVNCVVHEMLLGPTHVLADDVGAYRHYPDGVAILRVADSGQYIVNPLPRGPDAVLKRRAGVC